MQSDAFRVQPLKLRSPSMQGIYPNRPIRFGNHDFMEVGKHTQYISECHVEPVQIHPFTNWAKSWKAHPCGMACQERRYDAEFP